MKRVLVMIPGLAGVWLLLSGHYSTFLLILGAVSILLTVWVCSRMGIVDAEGQPIEIVPRLLLYLPWLLKEIVLANLDVIGRILNPSLPISPTLVEFQASQKTPLGNVILANSITLTPGTVSIRIRDGVILVHAIAKEGADGLLEGEMDRRVTRVEGGFGGDGQ